jgi:hypothetical protein
MNVLINGGLIPPRPIFKSKKNDTEWDIVFFVAQASIIHKELGLGKIDLRVNLSPGPLRVVKVTEKELERSEYG